MRRLRPAASDTKACPERGRAFFVGQGGTFFTGRGGAFSPGRDGPFPPDGDGLQPEQKKESAGAPPTHRPEIRGRFGEKSEKKQASAVLKDGFIPPDFAFSAIRKPEKTPGS